MTPDVVSVDPAVCTGCRTCELACGLHHTGRMAPAASSIRIGLSNLTSAVTWEVQATCDVCAGEEQPLCAKYCAVEAVRVAAAL